MKIGNIYFGLRKDKENWKNYIVPKLFCGQRCKIPHHYFKYYYRWFNFYWCKPRKCEFCKKYMTRKGGHHLWNNDGTKIIMTICDPCYEKDKLGWLRAELNYNSFGLCLTCKKSRTDYFNDCNCIPDKIFGKRIKCSKYEYFDNQGGNILN